MSWLSWIPSLVCAGIYVWSLAVSPVRNSPGGLVLFTLLMAAHGILRWGMLHRAPVSIQYYAIQGVLVLIINLLVMDRSVVLALSLMLLGEAAILIEDLRNLELALIGFLGVYGLSVVLLWGWEELPSGLVVVLPLALLLGVVSRIAKPPALAQDSGPAFSSEPGSLPLRFSGTPAPLPHFHPGAPLSLPEALLDEVNRFRSATRIRCALDLVPLPPLPEAICVCIIQTVAESLSNVEKYAQASEVTIRLGRSANWVEVEVLDNGIGFDPLLASGPLRQYSLLESHERALLAGGSLEITSKPGEGTRLRLRLPLYPAG